MEPDPKRIFEESKHKTLKAFGDAVGVSERTVRRWMEGAVPTGPSRAALRRFKSLQNRREAATRPMRIGICFEFIDTSLPILGLEPTGTLVFDDETPMQILPLPWSDHCLFGLEKVRVDIVIYNEACAIEYQDEHVCSFRLSDPEFLYESGDFYAVVRLAQDAAFSNGTEGVKELVRLIHDPDTVRIAPPADMRHALAFLREALNNKHNETLPKLTESDWLSLQPGQGLNLFMSPPPWLEDRNIVYMGGQDQLSAIRMSEEDETASGRLHWFTADHLKLLDIELPDKFGRNRMITREDFPEEKLTRIADRIEQSRQLIQSDESMKRKAKNELLQWHVLFNSRFSGADASRMEANQVLRREFDETCRLSATSSEWFGQEDAT